MSLLPWIGLIALLVATTAGALHLFLRVRAFLRTVKSVGGEIDLALRRVTRSLDELARGAGSVGAEQPRLEASLTRLRASLARVAILSAAVQDVRASVGRLTAVYPRK